MRELRLFQLGHIQLEGSYAHLPKGLRWLNWRGFPLESIPPNLYLRSLAVMDIQHSNLRRLWDAGEAQPLKKLKVLNLSHSVNLRETPDFSYLPNLEKLLLIDCKNLVLIHKSIEILCEKLLLVDLNGCAELEDLPAEFYSLRSLESLILSGCLKFKRLDDGLGEMEALTTLLADYTALRHVPSSIIQLKKLKNLSLCGCKGSWNDYMHPGPQATRLLPVSLNGLSCLRSLRLSYCYLSDELIPEDFGSLSCLEELDLQGNNFRNLRADFSSLQNLEIIRVNNCSELQSMLSLPRSLKSFHATNCISLERTPDLSECSLLQALYLTNCLSLVETPGLDKLKTVRVIRMEMCNCIADTFRETVLQGWAVSGFGGIFLPGSKLPDWFRFKDEEHSVSFTVPETHSLDLIGFTLCTRYTSHLDNVMSGYSPNITVINHTKECVWTCRPATLHILMYREEHLWQGHFSNGDFPLATGDDVQVDVNFGDQVTVLQIGVALVYEAKEVFEIGKTASDEPVDVPVDEPVDVAVDDNSIDICKTNPCMDEIQDISETKASIDETEDEELRRIVEEAKEAGRKRMERKMSLALRTFIGALGMLTVFVALGNYSKPQRKRKVPFSEIKNQSCNDG